MKPIFDEIYAYINHIEECLADMREKLGEMEK